MEEAGVGEVITDEQEAPRLMLTPETPKQRRERQREGFIQASGEPQRKDDFRHAKYPGPRWQPCVTP